MSQDDDYRRHAAECQRMAANTRNEADKARWLTLAEHWMRLVKNNKSGDQDSAKFDQTEAAKGTGQTNSESSH